MGLTPNVSFTLANVPNDGRSILLPQNKTLILVYSPLPFNLTVSLQQSNAFQQTGMSVIGVDQSGDNTAHMKGKLQNLNEICRQLSENLNVHKKEVQILRSEKETLESVLTMKCQDTRKALTNELHRV